MTAILGIQCDACGTADLEIRTGDMSEDNFPKGGWYSISQWEEIGLVGPEMHACSAKCVRDLGKVLQIRSKM